MSIQRRATIIWRRLSGVGGGAKSASRSHVRVDRRWSLVKRFSCRSGEKKTVTGGGGWEGDQRRAARDTNRRHRGGWEGGRKKEREPKKRRRKEKKQPQKRTGRGWGRMR
jgi:hypothetical protein